MLLGTPNLANLTVMASTLIDFHHRPEFQPLIGTGYLRGGGWVFERRFRNGEDCRRNLLCCSGPLGGGNNDFRRFVSGWSSNVSYENLYLRICEGTAFDVISSRGSIS